MSYEVKQGNIFGRLGTGIGRGLAETIPKEMERGRLAQGLQQFEQDSANLTPIQQLTRLASIPGALEHPQLIQSFSELARQQAKGNALRGLNQQEQRERPSPFPKAEKRIDEKTGKEIPSITTRTPIEATLKPYIPKSLTQLQQRAGDLLETNPGLYNSDPQQAMQAAVQEDAQEQSINQTLQGQRSNEQNVQGRIETGLRDQLKTLGVDVPGDVFSDIEDKAINAVKPLEEGGEGLTEQQAKKKYGAELDKISKDYESIKTIGQLHPLTHSASGNKKALRSIAQKFKERNDQENLAKTFISEQQLSPSKAFYLAYPITDNKPLNNALVNLSENKPEEVTLKRGERVRGERSGQQSKIRTKKAIEKIAPLMTKNDSPLAIAEELKAKGYDPVEWMDYVDKNRNKLDISERQARELDFGRDFTPTLEDYFLFYFSGLDKLVEQK